MYIPNSILVLGRYLSGGMIYTVPDSFVTTYFIVLLRFLFGIYVLTACIGIPYSVLLMSVSVLLADYRFYMDFNHLVANVNYTKDEDEDEE